MKPRVTYHQHFSPEGAQQLVLMKWRNHMMNVIKNRGKNVQTPEQEKRYPVYLVNPVKKKQLSDYKKRGKLE